MNARDTILDALQDKGCLGHSQDDEPVFVLCGRDIFSARLIREWADEVERAAHRAGELTGARKTKIAEARKIAMEMDAWRNDNQGGKLPD